MLASIILAGHCRNCGDDVPDLAAEVTRTVPLDAFDHEDHRAVYTAILTLRRENKPADITLVAGKLLDEGAYEGGPSDAAYLLATLFNLRPTWRCWQFYAARVVEVFRRRRARHRGEALIRAAHGADSQGPTRRQRRILR